MKRLLLLILIAGLGFAGYAYVRATQYLEAPMGQGAKTVVIPEGATYRDAVNALRSAGVVTDWTVFYWMGRWRKLDRSVKAGTYAVNLSWTPHELMDRLAKGALPKQDRLTIPEGFNRWQIADRVAKLGIDRAEFLRLVDAQDAEGQLFPDTYYLRPDATAADVVRVMRARFHSVFKALLIGHPDAAKYGEPAARRALVIHASLIEEEGVNDDDRRLIARVFENRLAKGMRLQTDPTCTYAESLYKKRPHPRYCKDPSNRYSTYMIDGLPPGPITNPGRSALDAALRPATGPDAEGLLYFVARRDGSKAHTFSRTFDEHKAKVRTHLTGRTDPQRPPKVRPQLEEQE